jgi:hypothetical protein
MSEITEPTRDPATGAWEYPATWSPEARAAWEAAAEELVSEERRLAKLEADERTEAESSEAKLAAQRQRLAEAKRAREAAEVEAADAKVWAALSEKHAGRVRRIYTEGGSIILRAMTEAEVEAVEARARGVAAAALEAGDDKRAEADAMKAYREGIFTKALAHPTADRARAILAAFPGAWLDVYAARDELNRGRREALGKGVAR